MKWKRTIIKGFGSVWTAEKEGYSGLLSRHSSQGKNGLVWFSVFRCKGGNLVVDGVSINLSDAKLAAEATIDRLNEASK